MSKIICNNCGKENHFQKNCPIPITSYGLLCVFIDKEIKDINNSIKYLMIQKRNSFAYIEFLRAKYNLQEPKYIQNLFNYMTIKEKELILNNRFNTLWNDLWLITNNKINPKRKSDFYKGIIKFNILQNGFLCKKDNKYYSTKVFINNSTKNYENPEWYFPKGRKNHNETDIDASFREFSEETNIDINNLKRINEINIISETHKGSNNINYKTIFYPTIYNKKNITSFNYKNNLENRNKYQKQEVGDIKWLTYKQVINKFRDYEIEKKEMFNNIHGKIINYIETKN